MNYKMQRMINELNLVYGLDKFNDDGFVHILQYPAAFMNSIPIFHSFLVLGNYKIYANVKS